MADEDDFEFDDIDEDTLAAIAEIENKVITASQIKAEPPAPSPSWPNSSTAFQTAATHTAPSRPGPPPQKRPRTEAWNAPPPASSKSG
ncbi:hypothetical protein FRC01_004295, partial [Tulasnella sp. 417]